MRNTVNISLTLTKEVLDAIDKDRGDIKRSTNINNILKDYFNISHNSPPKQNSVIADVSSPPDKSTNSEDTNISENLEN